MSELGPQEREEQLEALRRRMGKALRGGDRARLEALAAEYATAKREHMEQSERDHMARVRAARVQREAQQQVPARRGRVQWSVGRFGRSPGAIERDRLPPEPEPLRPPASGHLSPWRQRGSAMSERIWRP